MSALPTPTSPYTALAAGYDLVMQHVDYAVWADYVLELIDEHHPQAESILELGCGTGNLVFEILEHERAAGRDSARFSYLATDASAEMIAVARAKQALTGASAERLRFEVADFLHHKPASDADVVLLLYDGLNYLLDEEEVSELLALIAEMLAEGGIAIIDQSTPANSINNADYFGDEGEVEGFSYVRRSRYDEVRRLHITEFDLEVEGDRYAEEHVQRAYTLKEMETIIAASPLRAVAAYDGFTSRRAADATERIHWVMTRR